MRYCRNCVTPDTRPNVELDAEGICNACRAHATKKVIDWEAREKAFCNVVANAKLRSTGYDCLIPVSGGKDSTWQVVKCLEYGLTPLCVTWKTPARTAIGQRNLQNLVSLGVDHIDYQVNPKVERVFMVESLARFGTTALPMHMAIFNIPLTLAVRYRIPLVVWGENSAFEYGGTLEEQTGFKLDARWLKKYGLMHDTTARNWVGPQLTAKNLIPYAGPSEAELDAAGVLAVFLGYYFPWDPEESLRVAKAHGFKAGRAARTGYWNYADIDDDFISIHHWLKWYKFGFSRLFDNLSVDIRNGRMSRAEAVEIIRHSGDPTPRADISKFCQFADITEARFFELAEKFRNRAVWEQHDGIWTIKDFIIPEWRWS